MHLIPKPHIHVKNRLPGSIDTKLRMYTVFLFELRSPLCRASIVDRDSENLLYLNARKCSTSAVHDFPQA